MKAKACRKCSAKENRIFRRVCEKCGADFTDRNNKSRYCPICDPLEMPIACIDCGKPITRSHERCNSCSALHREPEKQPKGWRKYEYNGTRYRSKWEVSVAAILTFCKVDFKYELYHKETGTRPDFYIPALDRFVEIHPDYHGKKKSLPGNCVLVKSLSHARAAAFSVAFKVNKPAAISYFNLLSKQAQRGMSRVTLDLAMYLRQAIAERVGE